MKRKVAIPLVRSHAIHGNWMNRGRSMLCPTWIERYVGKIPSHVEEITLYVIRDPKGEITLWRRRVRIDWFFDPDFFETEDHGGMFKGLIDELERLVVPNTTQTVSVYLEWEE